MLFTFMLVLQVLVGVALVTVILMQRSEGGGLTGGGSPSGLMSARGAADFLTRTTAILATGFVALTIVLAFLAANRHAVTIDTSLNRVAPTAPQAPAPAVPSGAFGAVPGTNSTFGNTAAPTPLSPGENKATPAGAPAR
jgi:preprotein translocase subunit SecG